MRSLRVLLLYPPPWKIAGPGEVVDYGSDGPPPGFRQGDLDADFYQIPYGLLQLGAEATRVGHRVKVLNLSSYPWTEVEALLDRLDCDVLGMSTWTANRRGVALVAAAKKSRTPGVHVVVGGPHATPLAREMLAHHPAIDSVALGEADRTFIELLEALAADQQVSSIAGLMSREGDAIVSGPARKNIEDLDSLACVHEHFDTHILMTARGCPWACTFCGAETSWGRGFRSQSNDYVLRAMALATERLPVKMLQIKDDTFTTNKKRVLALCKSIQASGLSFFWSCDTRVDLLSAELLREMRLAGCQRLSFGVESGSQRILDAIDKKITPEEIIASTQLAKEVGIKVRFYMMLGNRGDDRESFEETLRFLDVAKPDETIFSCLSIYPGTRDFEDAEEAGWLSRTAYFEGSFQEFKTPFDASEPDRQMMNAWFSENSGLKERARPTVMERRRTLELLGDYHAAHLDLAGALLDEGDFEAAEHHARRALELGFPCPGLVYNMLAVSAARRRDFDAMMDLFSTAAKIDRQHFVLIRNINRAREWFKADGLRKGLPLELDPRHDFQLLERTVQPTLPGPLPPDVADWPEGEARLTSPNAPVGPMMKSPRMEGSTRALDARRHLPVVPRGAGEPGD